MWDLRIRPEIIEFNPLAQYAVSVKGIKFKITIDFIKIEFTICQSPVEKVTGAQFYRIKNIYNFFKWVKQDVRRDKAQQNIQKRFHKYVVRLETLKTSCLHNDVHLLVKNHTMI